MEDLFTGRFQLFWAVALAGLLFIPVRQLVWVLSVRRAERDGAKTGDEERRRLRRRSSVTAGLLVFVFSYFYTLQLFRDGA